MVFFIFYLFISSMREEKLWLKLKKKKKKNMLSYSWFPYNQPCYGSK